MSKLENPTLLSVNNYYYRRGGAEVVFLEHNGLFEEASWNVVPFSMRHPSNLDSEWAHHFVEEIEFGSDYSGLEKLRRAAKSVYSFEARRKIGKLIDEIKPDVCHAHNIYHHLSPAILPVVASRNIPVFLTLHDLKIACPAYLMLCHGEVCERCKGGRLYQVAARRCMKGKASLSTLVMIEGYLHRMLGSYAKNVTKFIVPSKFYIQKFIEWGFEPEAFRHVPNFVDSRHFEPAFAPGKRFLYFGRLSHEKGVGTLIAAAAEAGVGLDIVGTGPLESELKNCVQDMKADVRFHGFLSGEKLHGAIRSSRAVVLPSEWYENAPLSVLESYALGKPVLGSSLGGIPELIIGDQTGQVFAANSTSELASALEGMASKTDSEIVAMGRAGRKLAEDEYSPTRYVDRIRALYAESGVSSRSYQ